MRAVDTNILVYAHRQEPREHVIAERLLREIATAGPPWALPWPCIYEFLRVVTHPQIFHPASPLEMAWEAVRSLLQGLALWWYEHQRVPRAQVVATVQKEK